MTALACLALTFVGVPQHKGRQRRLIAAAAIVTALLFAVAEANVLLTETYLSQSRSAAAQTNWPRALADARAARKLQPWAASPPLQVALVQEQTGRLQAAAAAARSAIDHDPSDWRNWLIAARLQTKLGHDAEARCDLYAAAYRNPRSSLFRRLAPRAAVVLASCPHATRD
jgi:tetratricopeptide (TPR) repeat protein